MSLIGGCWSYVRAGARTAVKSERGASVVEYALLLALIAIVCVAAITLIGTTTNQSLSKTASILD